MSTRPLIDTDLPPNEPAASRARSPASASRSPLAGPMTTPPAIAKFGLLSPPKLPERDPYIRALPDLSLPEAAQIGPVSWFSRLLAFTGPGWLMSIAYVDPGNLEADLQCGAQFGYKLLWALLSATVVGLAMQLVAARLGCATRMHLAEHCRKYYAPGTRIALWLVTELAIVGSDIQEVIGSAIGLQLLFGMPLSAGVIVTATTAFGFLFLERLGTRPLELFFGALILILALSMGRLFVMISPSYQSVVDGLLIPSMPPSAMQQVVGMVGCVIMPHNLFLHSALVQSRVVEEGQEEEAMVFFSIESAAAITVSLMINTFVVSIFAKGFFGAVDADQIGLANAGGYLGAAFGDPLKVIWALGLVAAGQSSTMTGAYAGQWVMQGYLQLTVAPWKRAVITRSIALVPTLSVAVYFGGGNHRLDVLNSSLNILQSLVLPFAVIPLLSFAGSTAIMGRMALSCCHLTACWIATSLIMLANVYLFFDALGHSLPVVLFVAAYLVSVAYIAYVPAIPRNQLQ